MSGSYPVAYKPASLPYRAFAGAAGSGLGFQKLASPQAGPVQPVSIGDEKLRKMFTQEVAERASKKLAVEVTVEVAEKALAKQAIKFVPYVGEIVMAVELIDYITSTEVEGDGNGTTFVPDVEGWLDNPGDLRDPYDWTEWETVFEYNASGYGYTGRPLFLGLTAPVDVNGQDIGIYPSTGLDFRGHGTPLLQIADHHQYVVRYLESDGPAYTAATESLRVRWGVAAPEWKGPVRLAAPVTTLTSAQQVWERRAKRVERGHGRGVDFVKSPPAVAQTERTITADGRDGVRVRSGLSAPGAGTKERKMTAKGAFPFIWRLINTASEGLDAIEAVWDALDDKYKTGYYRLHKKGGETFYKKRKKASGREMLADLYAHYDTLNLNDVIYNLAVEQIKDYIYGKQAQTVTRASRPHLQRYNRPFGLTAGGAL